MSHYKYQQYRKEHFNGKGSRKKSSSLNGRAIKREGEVKGRAIKEKITVFLTFFSNVPIFQRPLSSRGEGV